MDEPLTEGRAVDQGETEGSLLGRECILRLLGAEPPLVEGLYSVGEQVQPNGVDLSLREVFRIGGLGKLGAASSEREIPPLEPLPFDADGWVHLPPGPYTVFYNEVVHLPLDVVGLARPRTSLLRSGVAVHTGVWDAGYEGRSQSLMVVYNDQGFRLKRGARIVQMVFFRMARAVGEGYAGHYQRENL